MITEAYILFLAFQDKLLSEGHYYVFLKEEQRRPSKCFTTLSWGGRQGIASFKAFPGPFWALSRPAPQISPFFLFIKGRAFLLTPREKADKFIFSKYEKIL